MTTATSYSRAFSTLGCSDLSPKDIRALGLRHGINLVELRGLDGSIDVTQRLEARYGTPANAAADFRALGLRVCALDTSLRLIGATTADRQAFLKFVPWAEAMGIPRLRVFDGGQNREADDSEIAEAAAILRWWRELRDKNGWQVDIMVETHSSIRSVDTLDRFLAKAPLRTGILWDSHHTWRLGGDDPRQTWQAIRHHVVHIHVKDSMRTPASTSGYTHTLCGEGEFPMRDLLNLLQADGYSGPVSLEWENLWHKDMPPLEDALCSATRRDWW